MPIRKSYQYHTQIALPFLETGKQFLYDIFKSLETKFGLTKWSPQKFIDLGSGDGRIVIYSVQYYKIRSLGVEIDENLVNDSKKKVKDLVKKKIIKRKIARMINFEVGDIFEKNLNDFEFVYIFSLPSMQKFLKHVFLTLKSGAIVVSHKYPLETYGSLLKLEYQLDSVYGDKVVATYFYKKQ
ncbi:MAG: class I SAM-dependent methyltransferase [Candidatus Lokiarchaeota archaeon]|nr:class I SAM-dependent methyltransferase [Candidatus Lokiarchaeota archaeon]